MSPAAHQQSDLHPPGAGGGPQSRVDDGPEPAPGTGSQNATRSDRLTVVFFLTVPPPDPVSPERLGVLGQREEVHDGDEDKLAGVVDDGQDGGEVVCAPAGRDLRGGALREAPEARTNQRGGAGERGGASLTFDFF